MAIEQISESELTKFKNDYNGKYIMAQCTDKFILKKVSDLDEADFKAICNHGIEIRVFDKDGEKKWLRGSIADKSFYVREISETNEKTDYADYWDEDEDQYLDIDDVRTHELREKTGGDSSTQEVISTGGGHYNLPIENVNKYCDAMIIIRNYLGYEEDTGRAFIKDYRIVEIKEGKEYVVQNQ